MLTRFSSWYKNHLLTLDPFERPSGCRGLLPSCILWSPAVLQKHHWFQKQIPVTNSFLPIENQIGVFVLSVWSSARTLSEPALLEARLFFSKDLKRLLLHIPPRHDVTEVISARHFVAFCFLSWHSFCDSEFTFMTFLWGLVGQAGSEKPVPQVDSCSRCDFYFMWS